MGFLWTMISYCLVAEIILIILFLLPFLSAQKWRKVFQFRIFAFISDYMIYFVVGLLILFGDSVNKVRKFNKDLEIINKSESLFDDIGLINQKRTNLFLAQRNLYMSFFGLLLWLVLSRLITMIRSMGQLQTDYETRNEEEEEEESPALIELLTELEEAKRCLESTDSQLKTTQADLEAMKSQSEATKKEYDRLLKELHSMESKKDD